MINNVGFSIIMPCYNSAAYVRNAVDSLLNQSYPNWELIAVNDGSTDNTLEILEGYAQQDARIKVYSKKNGGYATAINYGLDRISGDYFLMLGSDDRLSHDLFEKIVEGMNDKEPGMIAFRAIRYVDGISAGLDRVTGFDTAVYSDNTNICEYREEYPQHAKIMFIRDTAKCFKTRILGKLRYFGKYGYDADGIFSTLFSHKCTSFMSLPTDGYLWTIRNDSVSATLSYEKNVDRMDNWKQYMCVLKKERFDTIALHEKKSIVNTFPLACDLLKLKKKRKLSDLFLIHTTLRYSVILSKRYNLDLEEYSSIIRNERIKRIIFEHCPLFYLERNGFIR